MARATKILNKYEIKLLALSDRDINYDNFYKEELIAFCKCLKEEYKKQKEAIDKAMDILKDNFVYDYIRSCDTSDGVGYDEINTEHFTYKVYEILKEVSE